MVQRFGGLCAFLQRFVDLLERFVSSGLVGLYFDVNDFGHTLGSPGRLYEQQKSSPQAAYEKLEQGQLIIQYPAVAGLLQHCFSGMRRSALNHVCQIERWVWLAMQFHFL